MSAAEIPSGASDTDVSSDSVLNLELVVSSPPKPAPISGAGSGRISSEAKRPAPQKSLGSTLVEAKRPAPQKSLGSGALVTVSTRRSGIQPADAGRSVPGSGAAYRKSPGDQPLPGYVLIEPLGRGGFGEVWKCLAPGGLLKGIKFVKGSEHGGGHQLRQEYEAFEQVKAIRHPFLLCLERVELVEDELVMVMGLADRHIGERFAECRAEGLPGIPRDELISYLREAAEALDVISSQYGLQHLDVKPANLFLTAGHLQVGDYGLVSKLDGGTASGKNRGLTPKYAAPEVLKGVVHTQSDQYSLALVYQEMLTGCFPYSGRTPQQMMVQHVSEPPDLSSLPRADLAIVAQALAKSPQQRFASCLEFIDALGPYDSRLTRRSGVISSPSRPAVSPSGVQPPPQVRAANGDPAKIRLGTVRSVVAVEALQGGEIPALSRSADAFIGAVLSSAGGPRPPDDAAEVARLPDGAWSCRFLTAIDSRMAKLKLDLVWEEGGLTKDDRDANRVVFRKIAPAFRLFGKKELSGFEVEVQLPESRGAVGELVTSGRILGSPKPDFVRTAEGEIPALMAIIRGVLSDVEDRRKHPRRPAEFPVSLYPLHSDGSVDSPLTGRCLDVSEGGLAIGCRQPPPSKYFFVAFEGIPENRGWAILVQTIRVQSADSGVLVSGRYRANL